MSEDEMRLIAKIQHFYDLMNARAEFYNDSSISTDVQIERISHSSRADEILSLSADYSKVFHEFLYREV